MELFQFKIVIPLLHDKLVSSSIRRFDPFSWHVGRLNNDGAKAEVRSPELVVANNQSTSAIAINALPLATTLKMKRSKT